jgi:hypothetical protein
MSRGVSSRKKNHSARPIWVTLTGKLLLARVSLVGYAGGTQPLRSYRAAIGKQNTANRKHHEIQIKFSVIKLLRYSAFEKIAGVSGENPHLEKKIMLTGTAHEFGKLRWVGKLLAIPSLEYVMETQRRRSLRPVYHNSGLTASQSLDEARSA